MWVVVRLEKGRRLLLLVWVEKALEEDWDVAAELKRDLPLKVREHRIEAVARIA